MNEFDDFDLTIQCEEYYGGYEDEDREFWKEEISLSSEEYFGDGIEIDEDFDDELFNS